MLVPDWEAYLKAVLSEVQFKYDHNAIYFELKNHLEDRYEGYVEEGMGDEEATCAALACMGDAQTVGRALNKVHLPIIGWIWRILRNILILFIIINILPTLSLLTSGFVSVFESYENQSDSPLVYTIDVGHKEKVYDTTYFIDKILYYEDHTLEVRYATWTNPFSNSIRWNSSLSVVVYDENGEIRISGGGWKSGSFYGRGQENRKQIPLNATKVVISFGLKEKITIDLTEGRVMENES